MKAMAATGQIEDAIAVYINAVQVICAKYLNDLRMAAVVAMTRDAPIILPDARLVDGDGKPVSRPSRRQMERAGIKIIK